MFLTGCFTTKIAGSSESNYSQVVRTHLHPARPEQVMVASPDKQDAFVYTEPVKFMYYDMPVEIPLGKMIRSRAEDVFGRVFSAAPGQNQGGASGTKYTVTPVYRTFTCRCDFRSSGGSVILTMALEMEVIVKKADGTVQYREQFHETCVVNVYGQDVGQVATFELDKLVFNIMLKAANNTVVKIASTGTGSVAK